MKSVWNCYLVKLGLMRLILLREGNVLGTDLSMEQCICGLSCPVWRMILGDQWVSTSSEMILDQCHLDWSQYSSAPADHG